MGRSGDAKLFYGVCLNAGEHVEYEKDEDGFEGDRKPTLLDQIQEKFPEFDGYGCEIEGMSELLDFDILGYDDGLRDYLVLKSTVQSVCPGDNDIRLPFGLLVTQDNNPFREFFKLVGLPYEEPSWFLGCLDF